MGFVDFIPNIVHNIFKLILRANHWLNSGSCFNFCTTFFTKHFVSFQASG